MEPQSMVDEGYSKMWGYGGEKFYYDFWLNMLRPEVPLGLLVR
jgi:hypothetical protein